MENPEIPATLVIVHTRHRTKTNKPYRKKLILGRSINYKFSMLRNDSLIDTAFLFYMRSKGQTAYYIWNIAFVALYLQEIEMIFDILNVWCENSKIYIFPFVFL
jgi:hypothetical protein